MLKLYGILNLNLTIQKIEKKKKKYGGGILRFYFIHFFYLLTALNKNIKIKNFNLKQNNIEACFVFNNRKIYFNVNKNLKNKFQLNINNKINQKKMDNPFKKIQIEGNEDIRVKYLKLIINEKRNTYQNIFKGTMLWNNVEKRINY